MQRRASAESTAELYLELLAARGVRYFFGNGGTDFGPIVDAYAKRLSVEAPVPVPVTVPHEITAMAMAHGFTMVSGEPQVVMVHTVAGTANATGGLINATRAGVPMLFSAGRTPLTEGSARGSRDGGIHWAQESFDQGSMVREWVKWDYELRHGADLEGVVDRAMAISQTEPCGPVYLTLPREVLAEPAGELSYADQPRMGPSRSVAAPESLEQAARLLAGARRPLLITRSAGRDPAAVAPLVRLAEVLGMPVFESGPTHMNFPVSHELHQGGDIVEVLETADVIVVVEADVPWQPKRARPNPEATIISIAADPLYSRYPVRGFPSSVNLAGDVGLTLELLVERLAGERIDPAQVRARTAEWAARHERVRADAVARGKAGAQRKPLDKAWVAQCLEQFRDSNTIILNEIGLDTSQFAFEQPGTFFSVSQAGVLGWGIGAALGARLAAPDKTVVTCVGDGSYMFGVPSAAHWAARRYDLPVLIIVWNNAKWSAVESATRTVYPEGWAARTRSFPFSDLSPALAFEHDVRAAGGFGLRVESPDEVPGALEQALHAVREEHRLALLNMVA
ncbi:MAG: thiamine pyrophosphate-requiring protein [Chloroflexi bacterium]|nr:thiamine pyrophosphate-requiring protein [Chloroflexota bacterium]